MFKHRWGALFFVCLTAYGAVTLIGTKEEDGMLLRAADDIAQSRNKIGDEAKQLDAPTVPPVLDAGSNEGFSYDDEDDFADNDYDVDPTASSEGIEPSPDFDPDQVLDDIAVSDDIAIVVPNDEIEQ